MTYQGKIGDIVEIGRGDGEISSLEWRIPDFLSLAGERGDCYESPDFNTCEGEWCLEIYPKGLWQDSPSEWVSLILYREDEGTHKTFDVTLGIRGLEGVENKRERRQEFSYDDDRACFWWGFCSRSKLREQQSRLMPGNVLIVSLDMKSVVPSVARGTTKSSRKRKFVENGEASVLSKKVQGTEKAMEDFGKMLASGENSDVSVQVKEAEFRVHRNILSARSPVFSAMFRHETVEKASDKITVEDCEPEVFKEYLQYLYTGSYQSLTKENVFDLYRVADKYLADNLKEQCLEFIQDMLCVQTFCSVVQFALTLEESDLYEQAIAFASENIRSIICTIDWQTFIREYPAEANEVLIKTLNP